VLSSVARRSVDELGESGLVWSGPGGGEAPPPNKASVNDESIVVDGYRIIVCH
jgi:hypothetical protein